MLCGPVSRGMEITFSQKPCVKTPFGKKGREEEKRGQRWSTTVTPVCAALGAKLWPEVKIEPLVFREGTWWE